MLITINQHHSEPAPYRRINVYMCMTRFSIQWKVDDV